MEERTHEPHAAAGPLDEWQRHAGFLRRLALGLVGDLGLADDLVQEAWLASRGSERPGGRAWLAGVVKNLARGARRHEARRLVREERAAREEALPSADETVERVELLGRVVAGVRSLDEPYRTVLLLRFLDERSVDDVARLQGVPPETARTQVRRGLERLRQKLAAEGLDERRWLAAILPGLPLGKAAAVGAATTTPFLVPAILMSTNAKLLVTGVLVVAVSLVTWRRLADAPVRTAASVREEVAATPEPVRPPVATEAAPARAADGVRADERVALDDPALWRVHGVALLRDVPAPGVELFVRLWERADANTDAHAPTRETTIRTDAAGRFEADFADVTSTTLVEVAPTGSTATGVPLSPRPLRRWVSAGGGPEELELRLVPLDATVVGVVCDDEGRPLPGAEVWISDERHRTDEAGAYRIPFVGGQMLYVNARAAGRAQTRQALNETRPSEDHRVDFTLKDEFRVEGVVRDLAGRPLEGATVRAFYSHENDAVTDALGRYALGHLDPGRPKHSVSASLPGHVLTTEQVTTKVGDVVRQDFALDRGVRVSGRVVDADGAPVPGASLYVGFSPHAFNRLDAEAGPDGTFEFPSVQRGSETLVVQHPGFQVHQRVLEVPREYDELPGLEVVLEPGHFLAGRVLDEAGEPIAGAGISVRYRGERLEVRGETGADGTFRLQDLPADELRLGFYTFGRGLQRVDHDVRAVDVDDLEVVLPAGGGFAGRVVDDRTGEPVERFRVRFVPPTLAEGDERLGGYSATWAREGHLFESSDGSWSTGEDSEWAPGGVIGIQVDAEGYAPALVDRVVVAVDPDPDAFVVRLSKGERVRGTVVVAESGAPVADALVKLYRADEAVTDFADDTHGRPLCRTDEAGAFAFEGTAVGRYRVLVQKAGHPEWSSEPLVVAAGADAEVRAELAASARLVGTLLDGGGAPRSGVALRLLDGPPGGGRRSSVRRAVTGEQGRFTFEDLPAGSFRVGPVLGKAPFDLAEYERACELTEGETTELELRAPGTARLSGRLRFEGDPSPRIPVLLHPAGPEAATAEPAPVAHAGLAVEGEFELAGLAPGTYRITVRFYDYRSRTTWTSTEEVVVELAPDEAVVVEVPVVGERR